MLGFLIRLAVSAVALAFIAGASGGQIVVHGVGPAIIAALILGVANALVKPILEFILGALTFPLSCLTLGLWSLVLSALINGFLFLTVGNLMKGHGFAVKSFAAAVVGGLVMAVVNSIATGLTNGNDNAPKRRR